MLMQAPDFILYAQHGWADGHQAMAELAANLATPETLVITPNLGFVKTWIRMEPLIQAVEASVANTIVQYPYVPIRAIGHSMGGLIWIEVLARHPSWWNRIESLVLVGSPIGGADLARAFDPLALGLGIAKDLGTNRRERAEAIAAKIPTLIIAGDIDNGSDGTVVVQATKVFGAEFIRLPGLDHVALKNHPRVVEAIQKFWSVTDANILEMDDFTYTVIKRLQTVEGMTDGHERDFERATVIHTFDNGVTIRVWRNLMGIEHIFVACSEGSCLYGGFVGWLHTECLAQALDELKAIDAALP